MFNRALAWSYDTWKVAAATIRSAKQEAKVEKKKNKKTHPQKSVPTLALNRYLIAQAKLFDISAANQNQGGKCIFSWHFLFGPQKGTFYRGQFVIWLHISNSY